MLNILDLIADPQKGRQSQKELCKQDQYNQIMLKLKQRNTHNQSFISQYVKQTLRKNNKLLKIINCRKQSQQLTENSQIQDKTSLISLKCKKFHRDAQLEVSTSFELEAKSSYIDIKQTYKTEDTIDDDGRANNSLPVIMPFTKKEPKKNKSKALKNLKQSLDANKHIKNRSYKNSTPKENNEFITLNKDEYPQSNRQQNNKIGKSKMQLSIKTYIFGSDDSKFNKKVLNETIQTYQSSIDQSQRFKFLKKFQINKQLEERNQKKKTLLPSIKHQGPKLNRNYFMSHIRNTEKRLTKDQSQILRLYQKNQLQAELVRRLQENSSFRINTLQIKSKFD